MSDAQLLRVQAASGLVFLVFVVLHLLNLAVALLGVEAYNNFQRAARSVYQFPPIEIAALLLPLVVHAGAAFTRLRRAGFRRTNKSWRMRLHRYSGYFLLAVIVGHVAATRGPSLLGTIHPEFEGLAFSLWFMPLLFYPYYALLALSGLYHGLNGLAIALSVFGRPLPQRLRSGIGFWLPTGAVTLLLLVSLLALGGQLFEIPDPRANDYAQLYEEFGVVDLSP